MTPTPSSGSPPNAFDYAGYSYLIGEDDVAELLLVRHAQQLARGHSEPFEASIDPPLSAIGERQAALVGARFGTEQLDAVYCSRLERAFQTASALASPHGLVPHVVEDLREVEVFRDIEPGRTIGDVLGEIGVLGVRERMMFEKRWDVYPLSESSADFRRRAVNAIEGIAALNIGKRVAIVCHGGVINAYVAHHLGITADMFFRPQHAAVNVMLAGRHGVRALRSLGDVHHLAEHPDLLTF
jgi:probable phosphoglycerate mutase